ncbi:hypothetical protein EUTSA_v10027279mg [Eutrema salsugineum]|uniref:Expansin-like EG45 domain-containing protein n=1 Tax=Eutrema salsugineum TaxID=72664 RepID=V4LU67_EUTSA|nr:hypothetical protein EUTSA_v10027279mg [Eutrema salsugineum]
MERNLLVLAAIVWSLCSAAYAIPGKAAFYPSSIPTTCTNLKNADSKYIAAVNDQLWNNGRGCGKKFTVKCTGAHCTGKSVTVKIVDHCFGCPFTFYISPGAFAEIADPAAEIIDINYARFHRM